MKIEGKGTETYLYLNGIAAEKEIIIDERTTLLPAKCDPDPDSIIAVCQSEVDLGISTIFLRNITSQLKITASSPKELATKTWNSVWDAILLSAIFNCEFGCNIQCNQPAEKFSKISELRITNYHLRGLVKDVYVLTETDAIWLAKYFSAAKSLLQQDIFMTAVHSMSSYRWHSMPRIQLAVLWSGIEALFKAESEISFRISLYISKFLSENEKEMPEEIFKEVRSLYKARSSAVHGGRVKGESGELVKRSATLLNRIIRRCIVINALPNTESLIF